MNEFTPEMREFVLQELDRPLANWLGYECFLKEIEGD